MNPIYTIMETPHRWLSWAGIVFTVALIVAIAMLLRGWDHTFIRIWFYAGLLGTVYFLVRAFVEWRAQVEESVPHMPGSATGPREDGTPSR